MTLLKDVDEVLTAEQVDYCLMFGTLLGLLRHRDIIPWDDDLDIIVFDVDHFKNCCLETLRAKGYVSLPDVRIISSFPVVKKRFGYRIYLENGISVPGCEWKFPWLGIWEPDINNHLMTLPPETFVYNREDFFPLTRRSFLDFSLMTPSNSEKVLNTYFETEDWMEYCVPSVLNHRKYKPTGFPSVKFPFREVMAYLTSSSAPN